MESSGHWGRSGHAPLPCINHTRRNLILPDHPGKVGFVIRNAVSFEFGLYGTETASTEVIVEVHGVIKAAY